MSKPGPVFAWGSVSEDLALFKALTPEQRFKTFDAMVRQDLVRGEILVAQGDPADSLYIVLHGALAVRRTGDAQPIAELRAGVQPRGHRRRAGGGDRRAPPRERLDRLLGGARGRRAQLELGGEQLVAREALGQVEPRQDLGGDRRQRAVLVEQEELVLDADPERLALSERVLHQPSARLVAALGCVRAPISPLAPPPRRSAR